MDPSFWFDILNLGWSIVYIDGSQVIHVISKSFSVGRFALANSVDPYEMPHDAVFHLGLHCLPKDAFRSHQLTSLINAFAYVIDKRMLC